MASAMNFVCYSSMEMMNYIKAQEDELVERMGDTILSMEEGILEAKLSFPFVFNGRCVMIVVKNK
jgi:hypothetical protein